jgi:ABC-type phosphate/phosphonate transport system substrate-binding protein
LWDGVRSRLSFSAPALDWDVEPHDVWHRDDLLVAQACGWPLVTDLVSKVCTVGAFDHDVSGAIDGTYRSVLIGNAAAPLVDILHRPGLIVAANHVNSLSGWISLQSVAIAHGVRFGAVEWTGSHAASIEAVRAGRADLAAIDAVSWAYLAPVGVSVVGHGPRIPCLPLVTSRWSQPALVDELRQAFAGAVADPAMTDVCSSLRIRGYLDRDLRDYEGLSELVELW